MSQTDRAILTDYVHRIRLRDGGELAFEVHDLTGPASPGEPLILVHGFSKNRKFWYEWVPELARHYAVICVDLRGHGSSSVPPTSFELSIDPFMQDLVELVEQLGCGSAHFVMAEFAVAVGIEFAIRHSQLVRSITFAGFGYDFSRSGVDWLGWEKLVTAEGSEAWACATNKLRLPPETDERLKQWYVDQQSRVPAWLLAKTFLYANQLDLTDRLSQIAVPTLLLSGSAAEQISMASAKAGAALIPNSEFISIPNAPMNVMNARAQECVKATLAFLQRHDGPRH